jgi:hypothetical protein
MTDLGALFLFALGALFPILTIVLIITRLTGGRR